MSHIHRCFENAFRQQRPIKNEIIYDRNNNGLNKLSNELLKAISYIKTIRFGAIDRSWKRYFKNEMQTKLWRLLECGN